MCRIQSVLKVDGIKGLRGPGLGSLGSGPVTFKGWVNYLLLLLFLKLRKNSLLLLQNWYRNGFNKVYRVGNRVGCEMWSVFLAINSEAASSYKQIGCSCMYKNYDFWIYCSQETHLEKVVVERSHIIKDEFYSSGYEVRNISALKKLSFSPSEQLLSTLIVVLFVWLRFSV